MKGFLKFSIAVFLFIISCLISSCGQTGTVAPLDNTTVRTFNPDTLIIPHIGETVTGVLEFDVDPGLLLYPSDLAGIFIDGRYYGSADTKSLKVSINTYNFSEGPHTLSIGLINHKENNGLLNLTYEPYKKYTTRIVIDNSRPNAVNIKSAVYENGVIRLEWSGCKDKNFYCYSISRHDKDNNGGPIAKIYDRNVTAYTDSTAPEKFGRAAGYYKVDVDNRAESVSSSNYNFDYGTPFPFPAGFNILYNPLTNEIFAGNAATITAFSCGNNRTFRDLSDVNPGFNYQASGLFFNKSWTKLFVVWHDYTQDSYMVTRFDAATFKEEKSFSLGIRQLSSTVYPAADDTGLLYIKDSQYIYIFDYESGTLLNKILNGNHYYLLNLSPDGKYLYGYYSDHAGNSMLEKFSTSGNDLISLIRIPLGLSDDMILSRDGSKIYVLYKKLCKMDILSTETFSQEKTLKFSDVYQASVNEFYVSKDFVYASLFVKGEYKVAQYALSSLTETASWKFYASPTVLAASDDNKFLYSFSPFSQSGTWEHWIVTIK